MLPTTRLAVIEARGTREGQKVYRVARLWGARPYQRRKSNDPATRIVAPVLASSCPGNDSPQNEQGRAGSFRKPFSCCGSGKAPVRRSASGDLEGRAPNFMQGVCEAASLHWGACRVWLRLPGNAQSLAGRCCHRQDLTAGPPHRCQNRVGLPHRAGDGASRLALPRRSAP